MQKIAALLLAAVFAISTPAMMYADDNPPTGAPLPGFVRGTIVNETDAAIEIKPADGGSIILNLGVRPVIVDCVTGQPVALADRKDDSVAAYYGPAVTMSIPPQSNALVIICNIPQNPAPLIPHYSKVEAVKRTNGQVQATVDNGSLIVTINQSTAIFPYLTKNIVTMDNIDVGSNLLMWYPIVASSYPGQATAEKVLYLGGEDAIQPSPAITIELQIGNTTAMVNGAEVALDAPPIISNDRTMLPLRFIAENLHCTVDWNAGTKTAVITSGPVVMELQIGNIQAIVNGEAVALDAPPVILNNRTMLPTRFIAENLFCTVDWDESTQSVKISK